ncbi:NUDIX domain-containing protein [Streptomyces xiamenensis]
MHVIEGLALFKRQDHVLLIDRGFRATAAESLDLPGAYASAGELATEACQRGVLATTGIEVVPRGLLAVHGVKLGGTCRHTFIFDGGPVEADMVLGEGVKETHWVRLDRLRDLVSPHVEWRINVAADADAADSGPTRYLVGFPTHVPR